MPQPAHGVLLYSHFLQDDPLGVGRPSEGVGLQRRAQMRLLVLLVVPLLVAAVAAELPGGAEASALPCGARTRRGEGPAHGDAAPCVDQARPRCTG